MPELRLLTESPTTVAAPTTPDASQAITIRRNEVLSKEGTARLIEPGSRRKKESIDPEFATIEASVVEDYRRYLGDYIANLRELKMKNGAILQLAEHAHERKILELLDDPSPTVRNENIVTFLRSTTGLKLATQILEHQATYKLNAIALYETSNRPGKRDGVAESETIYTGDGQGFANKAWNEALQPNLKNIGALALAGAVGGASVYKSTGNLRAGIGAAVLAAGSLAAAEGITLGVDAAFRPGRKVDMKRTVDGLRLLQSSPDEAAYMKIMYAIDVNDFTIVGDEVAVDPRNQRIAVERLRKEAISALRVRNEFYRNLNVPKDRLDRMPEEFLHNYRDKDGNTRGPEQTSSRVQEQLYEIFDLKRDVLDVGGQNVLGTILVPPALSATFDPEHLDMQGNLMRLRNARVQVMTELAEELIKNEKDLEITSASRPMAALLEKKTGYQGEAVKAKRSAEETAKITQLNTEKGLLDGKLADFSEIEASQQELVIATDKLRNPPYSLTTLGVEPSKLDVNIATSALITSLKADLIAVGPPKGPQSERSETRAALNKYVIDENKARLKDQAASLGAKGSLSREVQNEILEQVKAEAEALYGDTITSLTERVNEITSKIQELSTLDSKFRTESDKVIEAELTLVTTAPKELVQMRRAYETLRPSTGASPITDALLETSSVDMLIPLAKAPPYGLANGTPEEQKALRKLIMDAKTELKARQQERMNPSPVDQRRAMREIALNPGLPINPDELFSKTDVELLHLLTTHVAYAGIRMRTTDLRLELSLAKQEARKNLRNRYKISLNEDIKDHTEQVEGLNKKIEGLGDFAGERALVEASYDINLHQSEIFTKAGSVVDLGTSAKFMDLGRYAKADEAILSDSEKALRTKAPKGYYEFMDLLFDYRDRTDKNEYFKKISTALPPDKLAKILDETLDLGAARPAIYGTPGTPARARNMASVLAEMNLRITQSVTGRGLEGIDIRRAFVVIMDTLQNEALSLP